MDFSQKFTQERLIEFAAEIKVLSDQIGFKVSSRGWGYLLEQAGFITKTEFDKVEKAINTCRKEGYLPVDFVAEEESRRFRGIEVPTEESIFESLKTALGAVLEDPTQDRLYAGDRFYTPDWWEGEEYYIQMVVEKIDLVTLFTPVCNRYHIPIANAKGWSSILQRAEYARRFREAEERGLQCVLLYCGDHDPDGLRISDAIRQNLVQIQDIRWMDGEQGYDPSNLDIRRFGLNYDFITARDYTWIDNLITGSGGNLASPSHRNHYMSYVQDYLEQFGPRKCEANAVVTTPKAARTLCRDAIEDIVGTGARDRFQQKVDLVKDRWEHLLSKYKVLNPLTKCINSPDEPDEVEESDE